MKRSTRREVIARTCKCDPDDLPSAVDLALDGAGSHDFQMPSDPHYDLALRALALGLPLAGAHAMSYPELQGWLHDHGEDIPF